MSMATMWRPWPTSRSLRPGVNALALTYDYALREEFAPLMRAETGNRMLAVPRSSEDLLNKLEAVRLVCQQTGCAQRYLAGDAFAATCRRRGRSMPTCRPTMAIGSRPI